MSKEIRPLAQIIADSINSYEGVIDWSKPFDFDNDPDSYNEIARILIEPQMSEDESELYHSYFENSCEEFDAAVVQAADLVDEPMWIKMNEYLNEIGY